MKKWKWKISVLLFASVFLLNGCGEKKGVLTEEGDSVINHSKLQVKEEGCFYIDGYTNLMMFYDYKLDKKIPICDQPNCKHNSSDCKAYLQSGYCSAMGCYQDKLYFFDVEDPEFPLYQAEKNGSNRKIVLKLNEDQKYDFSKMVNYPLFFRGNQLVFQISYMESYEEAIIDENGQEQYMQDYWEIVSVDVIEGKIETIKSPEKYNSVYDDIRIFDYVGDRIIYQITKDKIRTCYIYDTKQGTSQVLYESPVENALGGGYVGIVDGTDLLCYMNQSEEESQIYVKDLKTNEERCIFEQRREGRYIGATLVDDVLYYAFYSEYGKDTKGDLYECYHIKQEKTEQITKEQYLYAPDYVMGEWCVMSTDDGWACIPKEAYEKQEWDQIQVFGNL